MSTLLRQARDARGWSSARLRHQLRATAKRRGFQLATDTSLRVLISRWENGHARPDAMHRMLLEEAFDLPADALGIASAVAELEPVDLHPLVVQACRRTETPPAVLEYFCEQLREHSRLDNLAGPSYVLATARSQLHQLEQLAETGSGEVARLVARYAEFVGWLLQDSGDPQCALESTNRAIDYAGLAGDPELATYCTMRKSNILTDLGQHQLAASTARFALSSATDLSPTLAPVCLRQLALAAASLADEAGCRHAIEQALSVNDAHTILSPYCTTAYLWMEASLCLLTLGQPAAADQACAAALAEWPQSLVRDRTLCLARRAVAVLELREVDQACVTALEALEGVRLAPSGRAIHMLRSVTTRLQPYGRNAQVKELTAALSEVA